jgi:hypothetical protein
MKFEDLSKKVQSALITIKEDQLEGFYDERGYYAEFDSWDCKPFSTKTMLEFEDLDWVDFHEDSSHLFDDTPSDFVDDYPSDDEDEDQEDEEQESCSGVIFITIKPEFLDLIPTSGEE